MPLLSRILEELQTERQRYARGYCGKIVAALIYILAFASLPPFLEHMIPKLAAFMRIEYVSMVLITGTLTMMAVVWNVSMMVVYKLKLPFLEQYRINPEVGFEKPWPWQSDAAEWRRLLTRSIKTTAFSIYIVGGISLWVKSKVDFDIEMDVSKRLEIKWVLLQFYLMMLGEDVFFFSSHYLMHQPILYKYHKIHHQYQTSVSIAGLHFHPIQFFIGQSLSLMFSMKIASALVGPVDISTLLIWLIFRMWDAFNGHCGYNFTWAPLQLLPFCCQDDFHDFHHSQNAGNYGSHFRFWDSIFDTNRQFREWKRRLRSKGKQE